MQEWQRGVLHLVRDLTLIAVGLLGLLWAFQDRLLYPAPTVRQPWGTLTVERPGVVLRGWVIHPEAPAALVVFGGNAMAVSELGPYLMPCTSRAIYLLPYRGYEGQPGKPREADLVADGTALMAQVKARHAHVAMLGISLGTGVATQVAAAHAPDHLILVTPYSDLWTVANAHFHGLPIHLLMHDRYDSARAVGHLVQVPITVLQAQHDEVIPAVSTAALVRAMPRPPRLQVLPRTHNSILADPAFCTALQGLDAPASGAVLH